MKTQYGVQTILSELVVGRDKNDEEVYHHNETRTFIPCIHAADADNIFNALCNAPVISTPDYNQYRIAEVVVRFWDRHRSVIVSRDSLEAVAQELGFVKPIKPNVKTVTNGKTFPPEHPKLASTKLPEDEFVNLDDTENTNRSTAEHNDQY